MHQAHAGHGDRHGHESGGDEQDRRLGEQLPDQATAAGRQQRRRVPLVGLGVGRVVLRHQGVEFGLRLGAAAARRETANTDMPHAADGGEQVRVGKTARFGHHRQRQPHVGAGQGDAFEAWLGDADHGELAVVQAQRTLEHVRIGAAPTRPEAMGEHHDWAGTGYHVLVIAEEPAEDRARAEDALDGVSTRRRARSRRDRPRPATPLPTSAP